jgi:pilus assembly protein CpaC
MVVNTNRILTLGVQIIHQVQVDDPNLVTVNPLKPTQVLVSARKTGVTQINLWDEKNQVHAIDVVVVGDARELTALLTSEFPGASIKVRPVGSGVLISGYIDRPEDLERIKVIAEEYYPKVIMNITVGGVQQVQLHVRVYEVSRSKLRTMGFDFAQISSGNLNTLVRSGVSGLISTLTQQAALPGTPPVSAGSTFQFGIVSGNSAFFGVLEALCQSGLAKVITEPRLVCVSGRTSLFTVGGEIPYTVSQGLGAVSTEWAKYGTTIRFAPIVLGNGAVHLELNPEVKEVDKGQISSTGVPAFKQSEVKTAVELQVGQTLAIAGLVQTRVEARTSGIPWISDVPYLGALFRRVHEERNEIETLILVTPEFAEAMDPHEVPQCGPGMRTTSPSDWELYMEGHIEVPNPCPPCNNGSCPKHGAQAGRQPSGALPEGGPAAPLPTEQASAQRRPAAMARGPGAGAGQRPAPARPQTAAAASRQQRDGLPGFMGPIGYDVTE